MNELHVGVYVNNRLPLLAGGNYSMGQLIEAAEQAEALGYDSVWVGDSPISKPRLEPITTLAAIAMRTRRVRLGTNILQPHLRNPMWLALSWATLDHISEGRTIFGAGVGAGHPDRIKQETAAAGIDKTKRGQVFEDTISLLRRLWSGEEVTATGPTYSFDRISLEPLPVQRPHPPIWIAAGLGASRTGTGADATLAVTQFTGPFDRVARLADGWLTAFVAPEECAAVAARIAETARGLGRTKPIPTIISIPANVNQDGDRARRDLKRFEEAYRRVELSPELVDRFLGGTPDECVVTMKSFIDAGASGFILVIQADDMSRQVEIFATDVIPEVRRYAAARAAGATEHPTAAR